MPNGFAGLLGLVVRDRLAGRPGLVLSLDNLTVLDKLEVVHGQWGNVDFGNRLRLVACVPVGVEAVGPRAVQG